MAVMKNFAGSIIWQSTAQNYTNEGQITLPDGELRNIVHERFSSMVHVANGPFFTGSDKYFLVKPDNSLQEFATFDDLMMHGLNQTRLET